MSRTVRVLFSLPSATPGTQEVSYKYLLLWVNNIWIVFYSLQSTFSSDSILLVTLKEVKIFSFQFLQLWKVRIKKMKWLPKITQAKMELKLNHESSDQSYLFILLKIPPTCSAFISHLWQLEELNLFCPKFVSLNFVVEYERSGSLLFICSWCCLLDLCLSAVWWQEAQGEKNWTNTS